MHLHSLKAKFISVIMLISVGIGVVSLVALKTSIAGIIDGMALRFATKEALLEKNKILSIIDREVVLARKMADDPTLRRWVANENDPGLERQAALSLESYRKFYRDQSFFIALARSKHYYFYDKRTGRVETAGLKEGSPDDKWFFEGLRNIKRYAVNLDYNPTLGEAKIWFNSLMVGEDGKPAGICGGGLSITDFLREIIHSGQKGVSTMLVDGSGVIEAHEDRGIVEHNANERDPARKKTIFTLIQDPAQQRQLRQAITSLSMGGSEVHAFPVHFGGRPYLLAVSNLAGIGWFNVVLVDASEVISTREFVPMLAVMSLSLLLIVATIGWLINRIVLAPLTALSAASAQVAGGRYDISLPVDRRDELGDLTGSFNSMTTTIREHTENLEEKVRLRTDELSAANVLLQASQKKITESIAYARTIQASILPPQEALRRALAEHFILYRPKEMVGGDFYYLREFPDHFLVAAVDCTGHGIPGAFMTMTVYAMLNQVVDHFPADPARILSELTRVMQGALHLSDVDAGLDMSLCMVERNKGLLSFAGAGLSCFLATGDQVREVRGDHQRVGYRGSKVDHPYTAHQIQVRAGDCCYLCTDGVLDEPGGEKGYGFGTDRFKAALAEHAPLPMAAQKEELTRTLDHYRGGLTSRDDVTVLGFRL